MRPFKRRKANPPQKLYTARCYLWPDAVSNTWMAGYTTIRIPCAPGETHIGALVAEPIEWSAHLDDTLVFGVVDFLHPFWEFPNKT